MNWQPIEEMTDNIRYNGHYLIYHPDYVHEDFNPDGVIEGFGMDSFDDDDQNIIEWIGTVWNACHDIWDTKKVTPPIYFMVIKGPDHVQVRTVSSEISS